MAVLSVMFAPFQYGSALIRMNFPCRIDPFLKELGAQECKQEVRSYLPCENGREVEIFQV